METWRPISEADKTIVDVQEFPDVGITIRNSAHILARDEDGRAYEAAWTDHKGGYWWDFDSESPVDPVEFMAINAETLAALSASLHALKGESERQRAALKKIAELRWSEAEDPLEEACDIAEAARASQSREERT